MARTPPNNHFTPILADRFGGFKMAIAPPNIDFTATSLDFHKLFMRSRDHGHSNSEGSECSACRECPFTVRVRTAGYYWDFHMFSTASGLSLL